MGIQLQGKDMTQEQLDAVLPVINARMIGRIGNRKFEAACLEAMDKLAALLWMKRKRTMPLLEFQSPCVIDILFAPRS